MHVFIDVVCPVQQFNRMANMFLTAAQGVQVDSSSWFELRTCFATHFGMQNPTTTMQRNDMRHHATQSCLHTSVLGPSQPWHGMNILVLWHLSKVTMTTIKFSFPRLRALILVLNFVVGCSTSSNFDGLSYQNALVRCNIVCLQQLYRFTLKVATFAKSSFGNGWLTAVVPSCCHKMCPKPLVDLRRPFLCSRNK